MVAAAAVAATYTFHTNVLSSTTARYTRLIYWLPSSPSISLSEFRLSHSFSPLIHPRALCASVCLARCIRACTTALNMYGGTRRRARAADSTAGRCEIKSGPRRLRSRRAIVFRGFLSGRVARRVYRLRFLCLPSCIPEMMIISRRSRAYRASLEDSRPLSLRRRLFIDATHRTIVATIYIYIYIL